MIGTSALDRSATSPVISSTHLGVHVRKVVEQFVERDLEAVDGELELSAHLVHELQLDAPAVVVVQREKRPAVVVRHLQTEQNKGRSINQSTNL